MFRAPSSAVDPATVLGRHMEQWPPSSQMMRVEQHGHTSMSHVKRKGWE